MQLEAEDAGEINAHDRKYFYSLYVREPGGTLFEFATDAPGMTIDESLETLGTKLFVPEHFGGNLQDNLVMLPQFGLPGEERFTERDLPFIHRLHQADNPDGTTLVLLHGSGANETSLLPLGRQIAPKSLLLSLRGRSTEEGHPRFFRRITPFTFDQKDIASEVEAFVAMIEGAISAYGLNREKMVFVGYSNGANMLIATMLLHPGLIRKAALLRMMNPLDSVPDADLSGTEILLVTGKTDDYSRYAAPLEGVLRNAGATLATATLDAGHEIGPRDADAVRDWLKTIGG
jgi:phospholipase/carboxylesterase